MAVLLIFLGRQGEEYFGAECELCHYVIEVSVSVEEFFGTNLWNLSTFLPNSEICELQTFLDLSSITKAP